LFKLLKASSMIFLVWHY